MSVPLLNVSDLQAWYGESHVLHGLNLHVNEGEMICILGRNGMGKTTSLRAIMGIQRKRTGQIEVGGQDIMALPLHKTARAGLGFVPEERGIFATLSVEENLILSGLGALIALMRFGIRRFWAEEGPTPRILALEVVPVVLLLAMIALQTLRADALLSYTRATAVALLEPGTYRDAVLKNAQDVRAAPAVNLAPAPPGIIEADP